MRSAQAFIAMHWGEEYVSGHNEVGQTAFGVNGLTLPAFCPSSKQPELKHAAVKIQKAELPWRLVAFAWVAPERALQLQQALRPYLARFAYASCTLFGRERVGVTLRAAAACAQDAALLQEIDVLFGLNGANLLRYDDARGGHARRILVEGGKLAAVLLAGDVSAEGWLRQYLDGEQPVLELGRMLLMPSSQAPAGFIAKGRVVCNCLNVSESAIVASLAAMQGLVSERGQCLTLLQQQLKCGSSCGSCVPELKQMIAASRVGRDIIPVVLAKQEAA
jgi:assimilatory nitrate reductase catalytic subunit